MPLTEEAQAAISKAIGEGVTAAMAPLLEQIKGSAPTKVTYTDTNPAFLSSKDHTVATSKDLYGECDPYDQDKPLRSRGLHIARFARALALAKLNGGIYGLPKWADQELKAGLAEGNAYSGAGVLVPAEFVLELIPLLRARSVVRNAGVPTRPMNSNVMNLPRQTGSGTANYVAEATQAPLSVPTFDSVQLSAKKLVALVRMSNDLIRDSSPAADAIARDDMVQVMSLRTDYAFLRDDGTSNKPTGVRNQSGINILALGSGNGATITYDNLIDLLTTVGTANANWVSPGWIMPMRVIGSLRKIKDTAGRPILEKWNYSGPADAPNYVERGNYQYELLGYPVWISNQIPTNLTVGTSTDCTEVYFGDWSEAVIGENEELLFDTSSEAAVNDGGTAIYPYQTDETIFRTIARHDFGLRHPPVFVVMTGARP